MAETGAKDPHNQNFCGFGTGRQCLAFVSEFGVTIPLHTLGGTNATLGAINNLGEIAGIAQNGHHDPKCPSSAAVNGTEPLFFDFEAVFWGPFRGEVRELPPLRGDTVGMALGINDTGQGRGPARTRLYPALRARRVLFYATETAHGDLHGFLAKPCDENSRRWNSDDVPTAKRVAPVLSERARSMLVASWLRRHWPQL